MRWPGPSEVPDESRTMQWDGGWFSVVGTRLATGPHDEPWLAIQSGRRHAAAAGIGHRIDLQDGRVTEEADDVRRLLALLPWSTPPTDDQATVRAGSAADRAQLARERRRQLADSSHAVSEETAQAAGLAARLARHHATVARARAADVFERAALAHEQAALVHDRLASLGVSPERHRARARDHREAARRDWDASRTGRSRP